MAPGTIHESIQQAIHLPALPSVGGSSSASSLEPSYDTSHERRSESSTALPQGPLICLKFHGDRARCSTNRKEERDKRKTCRTRHLAKPPSVIHRAAQQYTRYDMSRGILSCTLRFEGSGLPEPPDTQESPFCVPHEARREVHGIMRGHSFFRAGY